MIDVWPGVVHTALLTMSLTSGLDVSMPVSESAEDSLNIHCDINLSKHCQL